jgi:hypothetical protein
MKTKTVTYQDEEHDVRLVVAEATAEAGIVRALLLNRIQEDYGEAPEVNDAFSSARNILLYFYYPRLISVTVESEGLDAQNLTPQEFANLPEDLFHAWYTAVFELNPTWRPVGSQTPEEEAAEKKDAKRTASASETG